MKTETVAFGGGCFWCTEAVFALLKGIESVEPGYAGGTTDNPSYFRHGDHAEVSKIEFDPSCISFQDLLAVFLATHDPTSVNQQGADIGTQYRSVVLYTTDSQREICLNYIEELNNSSEYGDSIVTEVKPFDRFFPAEEVHRKYYQRNAGNGYCRVVINPKLQKAKEKFASLLAEG